jgi:hypothetical protein
MQVESRSYLNSAFYRLLQPFISAAFFSAAFVTADSCPVVETAGTYAKTKK